jgi:hypothetical protein
MTKVWIKVCYAQSEPDWSIKKAELRLRQWASKNDWAASE